MMISLPDADQDRIEPAVHWAMAASVSPGLAANPASSSRGTPSGARQAITRSSRPGRLSGSSRSTVATDSSSAAATARG